MEFLPLMIVLKFPANIQFIYFALCFVIAIAGRNRKMGFWGYLFCSIILSPIIGLMVVTVSEKQKQSEIT